MNNLKIEMIKSLNALALELDESIQKDAMKKFIDYSNDIEDKLLQATRNLGHPAYNQSAATTSSIDELREELFDFLDIPKPKAKI